MIITCWKQIHSEIPTVCGKIYHQDKQRLAQSDVWKELDLETTVTSRPRLQNFYLFQNKNTSLCPIYFREGKMLSHLLPHLKSRY